MQGPAKAYTGQLVQGFESLSFLRIRGYLIPVTTVVCTCVVCKLEICRAKHPSQSFAQTESYLLALVNGAVLRGRRMVCARCKGGLAPLKLSEYKKG